VLGNAGYAAGRLNRAEMALLIGSTVLTVVIAALAARALRKDEPVAEPQH